MEDSERPHPHHLAEKLPPVSHETSQESKHEREGEKGPADLVGEESEGRRGSTADTEKGEIALSASSAAMDFPDGGLRAWR